MKRFGAVCALAFALIFLTAGCNDYGNTFQSNTGARADFDLAFQRQRWRSRFHTHAFRWPAFVAKTVVQWNGKNLATTPVLDANSNVL